MSDMIKSINTDIKKIHILFVIELERAFRSRMFWLMLLTGIVITGIEFIVAPLKYSNNIIGSFDGNIGNTINTVFNSWFFSLEKSAIPLRQLYIMIMPLMATFAYGFSAVSDIKTGYIKNIYTRIDKKYYLLTKCFVSHIAGGTVIVIPLLLNLIACSMILPSVNMEPVVGFYEPRGFSMLSDVAYTHPYIYIFIELFVIYMYSGLFTTFCIMLSQIVQVYFITTIFPFLFNYFCYIIQNFLKLEKYNPIRIMTVGYSYNNTFLKLIIEYLIIWVILFSVYMYRGMHNETL